MEQFEHQGTDSTNRENQLIDDGHQIIEVLLNGLAATMQHNVIQKCPDATIEQDTAILVPNEDSDHITSCKNW